MFERYTEKARRVIFFARYEASQFGSPYIETEHMLLGILREDKALTSHFLRTHSSVESIRKQIEVNTTIREKVSTSVDLPLSNECKRVLAYAAEEAERLGHKHLGPEHLLLGLLREENCFAADILKERGVQLASVRDDLAIAQPESPARASSSSSTVATTAPSPSGLTRDLTQAALDGRLDPIVARDQELTAIIEILCGRRMPHPILLGERGAGRTAIVQGLALRLASCAVPPQLFHKRIVEVEPGDLAAVISKQKTAVSTSQILFFDCRQKLFELQRRDSKSQVAAFLHFVSGHFQCIALGDTHEFRIVSRTNPWLLDLFREIHIRPLDEQSSLLVLRARKASLEDFHNVSYSDATLEAALRSAITNPCRGSLLKTALDLLDAAGTLVSLREVTPEIAEARKKFGQIQKRLGSAIANHEFEKARFYSDEERKERENLRALQQQQRKGSSAEEVTPVDISQVLSRWSTNPYIP